MFLPEQELRDIVLSILEEDPRSISALWRDLAKRGIKLHRLELTGYLKALADLGVLREKDIKPSKVFAPAAGRDQTLYELLGAKVRERRGTDEDRLTLAAYTLQQLFRRPVFALELARCKLPGIPRGRKATGEERAEARALLQKQGYKVPTSDVPIIVTEKLQEDFYGLLVELIVAKFGLRSLVKETEQLRLFGPASK